MITESGRLGWVPTGLEQGTEWSESVGATGTCYIEESYTWRCNGGVGIRERDVSAERSSRRSSCPISIVKWEDRG